MLFPQERFRLTIVQLEDTRLREEVLQYQGWMKHKGVLNGPVAIVTPSLG
jgi:hypothetical protein